MIHVNFNIRNPWSNFFKTGYVWSGNLIAHKFWELQAMRTSDIVCFNLSFSIRQDHAGFNFELGLLSFNISFTIYDHRHWDHLAERYENSSDNQHTT